MTTPTETSRVTYVGNGVTTAFAVPFRFFDAAHITVTLTAPTADPVVLIQGVDFEVTGAGDPDGGEVVTTLPPASGADLAIEREVPLTQDIAFTTQGPFAAQTHEDAFDYARQVDQQLDRRLTDLENASTDNNAVAGSGLYTSDGTWHVGGDDSMTIGPDIIGVKFQNTDTPTDCDASSAQRGNFPRAARADHKHRIVVAAPVAITPDAVNEEGVAYALARADHVHEVLTGDPGPVYVGGTDQGASLGLARADHCHDVMVEAPVDIGSVNDEGTSSSLSRGDHIHAHGSQAGGATHALANASTAGFMAPTHYSKVEQMATACEVTTVNTSNNTPTVIWTRTVVPSTSVVVEATVVAREGSGGAGYRALATFRRGFAGAASQVGSTSKQVEHESDAAWDIGIALNGSNIEVKVTGGAVAINWAAFVKVFQM